MELVPETERASWHDKAMEAAVQSDASISVLLPLLIDTKEVAHLARVIDRCADDHLSHAGHRTVEAAEALDVSYPEQAARLWRALGLGIVNRGKSKQYTAAVNTSAGRSDALPLPGSRTTGTSSWTRCARTTAARPALSASSRR